MRAVEQEKEGTIYHLRGHAEIDYRTYVLRADQITYHATRETANSKATSCSTAALRRARRIQSRRLQHPHPGRYLL